MTDPKTAVSILQHALANRNAAGTFLVDGVKWIADGARLVPVDERLRICKACDRWRPIPNAPTVFHCAECKCLAAKLRMATARCPLDKWLPV